MPLPFFYSDEIKASAKQFVLNEETSKHVVQVLRMQNGEPLQLTDGKGTVFIADITYNDRKKCTVTILSSSTKPAPLKKISIGISLVKNSTRFEWFLEKATEIGITEVIPMLCTRTEKQHFRHDRMKNIVISAMLQSQQAWLPKLHEPTKFMETLSLSAQQKFIAHCEEGMKEQLSSKLLINTTESFILIGPEGDFTREEIAAALQNNFLPVALGDTRLRTETAGVVAATLLCLHQ